MIKKMCVPYNMKNVSKSFIIRRNHLRGQARFLDYWAEE
jgi:hypothetical protein